MRAGRLMVELLFADGTMSQARSTRSPLIAGGYVVGAYVVTQDAHLSEPRLTRTNLEIKEAEGFRSSTNTWTGGMRL